MRCHPLDPPTQGIALEDGYLFSGVGLSPHLTALCTVVGRAVHASGGGFIGSALTPHTCVSREGYVDPTGLA